MHAISVSSDFEVRKLCGQQQSYQNVSSMNITMFHVHRKLLMQSSDASLSAISVCVCWSVMNGPTNIVGCVC